MVCDLRLWLDAQLGRVSQGSARMVRGEVRSTELATLLPWAWRQPGSAAEA
jgi:hypothetical protein